MKVSAVFLIVPLSYETNAQEFRLTDHLRETKMANITNFHVVPATDRWQIIRDGVLFAECQSKKFAVSFGRKMAMKHGTALVIHPGASYQSGSEALRSA
jgi:hypothetical protein